MFWLLIGQALLFHRKGGGDKEAEKWYVRLCSNKRQNLIILNAIICFKKETNCFQLFKSLSN